MKKQDCIDMGYQQVKSTNEEALDTLVKVFDNGNAWVMQFNEDIQEKEIGKVYLFADQLKALTDLQKK